MAKTTGKSLYTARCKEGKCGGVYTPWDRMTDEAKAVWNERAKPAAKPEPAKKAAKKTKK